MRRTTFGRLAAVAIALAAVIGGPAATSAVMPHRPAAQKTPGVAPLVVYGGRSLAQQRSGVGGQARCGARRSCAPGRTRAPGKRTSRPESAQPSGAVHGGAALGCRLRRHRCHHARGSAGAQARPGRARPAAPGRLPERRRWLVAAHGDRDGDASERTALDAGGAVAHPYRLGHLAGRLRAGFRNAAQPNPTCWAPASPWGFCPTATTVTPCMRPGSGVPAAATPVTLRTASPLTAATDIATDDLPPAVASTSSGNQASRRTIPAWTSAAVSAALRR